MSTRTTKQKPNSQSPRRSWQTLLVATIAMAAVAASLISAVHPASARASSGAVYPANGVAGVSVLCSASDYSCDGGGYSGSEPWGYYTSYGSVDGAGRRHNCTTYAAFRAAQNGAPKPTWYGNANQWDEMAAAASVPVDGNAVVGAIAQWNSGSAGHLAYVESVDADGIVITDDNYGLNIARRVRIERSSPAWPDNFIHLADVGSSQPSSDTTPPSITCAQPDGVWHASNVSLDCTASDDGSGLADGADAGFTLTTFVAPGSEDGNAATGSLQVCDNAGNCATAGPIGGNKIDMQPPSVTCASPDGQWHGANVSLGCGASDGGSGLANAGDGSFPLSTSVPAGTEDANASTDSRQVCDSVGNCSSAGPIGGNKVDLKAPEVAFLSPAGLGTIVKPAFQYPLSFALKFTTTDGGSGIASWTLTRHVAGSLNSTCRTSWHVDRTITGSTGGAALADSERLGLGRCYFWTLDSVDAVGNHSSQAVSEVLRTPKLARVT